MKEELDLRYVSNVSSDGGSDPRECQRKGEKEKKGGGGGGGVLREAINTTNPQNDHSK